MQAFQAMQSKGCKPDSIVYNAIIDALWDTGIVWAQQHAALLYKRASSAGHTPAFHLRLPLCMKNEWV